MQNTTIVDSLMDRTYPLQRLDISKNLPISDIKANWPFLFLRKYMLSHAEKLVGFPVSERFEKAVSNKIPELFSFLKNEAAKNPKIAAVDFQSQHLNYVPALAAYFEEDCNVIFKIFEENKSLHEVQDEAPLTPFIACIGNPYQMDPVCTVLVEKVPFEPMIPSTLGSYLFTFSV
ncbi:unnamed protein product [Larinioides sclopetarius]|uniref:Uncharacterized protein n=1 Tax=Larinioides sclopetarius TaxID=280406 RepID=A0AAV2BTQ6_9ARAC